MPKVTEITTYQPADRDDFIATAPPRPTKR